MSRKNFDLVVIGTGTGGISVASKCVKAGMSVAIIDSKPFGGTCALRGCDPKKILVGFVDTLDQVKRFNGVGLDGSVKINWEQLIKFKEAFTSPIPHKREDMFKSQGIEAFHGEAKFSNPNTIHVGKDTLVGKKILIATGAKAMDLPFEGQEHLLDNEQFLNIKTLPRRILFVGGGYISMEFAHICIRSGAEVTLINDRSQILSNFDPFLVEMLEKHSRELGINIINESSVQGVYKKGDSYIVKYKTASGEKERETDLVVHGAGRSPNIQGLNLEIANVVFDKKGIEVNSYMQSTSNPAIYAAGDVAKGGLQLTPVASYEAHIVASNIIKGNNKEANYPYIPSVVFTIPHLASVGLTESEAQSKGIKYKVNQSEISDWYSARRLNERYEGYKILLSEDGKQVLGAHFLSHRADELINISTMVLQMKISPVDFKKMIFAYPTVTSDISYML
jgi:glutathione reductase (NADPH)